jgi:hypothetical protein
VRFFRFTEAGQSAIIESVTGSGKKKNQSLLQELLATAARMNIEVRTEKLLREVGYHARSGGCRVKGQQLIIVDRDAPLRDQVEFLTEELMAQGALSQESFLLEKKVNVQSDS